jgi:uncharacterized membrane protein YoaK (UPF0700 family)
LARRRDRLLLVLAWSAGFVDAASFLGLGRVFTANMTGNTVFLGLALGRLDLAGALRSIAALAGFCLGVVTGAMIPAKVSQPMVWPRAVTITLMFECLALTGLAFTWRYNGPAPEARTMAALIVLSGYAMGLQSAALKRIGVPAVGSTAVTGTVTGVMAGAVGWLHASSSGSAPHDEARQAQSVFRLSATVWFTYAFGALAGGTGSASWHGAAILCPAVAVGLVTLIALLSTG